MKIRITGNRNQLKRLKTLLNDESGLYENMDDGQYRFYLNLDDSKVEQWLKLLETYDGEIKIDLKDFRS